MPISFPINKLESSQSFEFYFWRTRKTFDLFFVIEEPKTQITENKVSVETLQIIVSQSMRKISLDTGRRQLDFFHRLDFHVLCPFADQLWHDRFLVYFILCIHRMCVINVFSIQNITINLSSLQSINFTYFFIVQN